MSLKKYLVILLDLFLLTFSLFDLCKYTEVRSRLDEVALKINETAQFQSDFLEVIPSDISYLCLSGCKERIRKYRLTKATSFVLCLSRRSVSQEYTQIMTNINT